VKETKGICPNHNTPYVRRLEPCLFFEQSKFQERLVNYFEANPSFIQPESRRNEMLSYVQGGLQDVNITRSGQTWGIPVPFDPSFTIWVWFDALLTYFTGIGYASDDAQFAKWWPASIHFIGKDITRFHCALWPAMLLAAGIEPPQMVFSHGWVNNKGGKISKSLGNIVEPMDVVTKFSAEAFRYYFMRECPFPGDGDFSWERFAEVYNSDLANNLGNLYSRAVTLITKNYGGHLAATANRQPGVIYKDVDTESAVQQVQKHIEACQYNVALEKIWRLILDPTNQYADKNEPWKLVKTDKAAAGNVLYDMVEQLRIAAILLKPFLPTTAQTIYQSFNFPQPWEQARYEDVWVRPTHGEDLRVVAALEDGKVKPLFPRIN
jgi:methionyl-tRNA synthetase